jgi:hypothetical protein
VPEITTEGYLWVGLILATCALAALAGLLSVPDIGFGASVRFALAIISILLGLTVIGLFWLRAGGFGCFGLVGTAIALWGARNSWSAYAGLVRGERPLTAAERHVREVVRKAYREWIEEASLEFDGGAALLELRLTSAAPLEEVRLNLTSLAQKYEAGMNDAVLERAVNLAIAASPGNSPGSRG